MENNINHLSKFIFFVLFILSLSGCGGGSDPIPDPDPYAIVDLGVGFVTDINELGHVTGISDGRQAYIYDGQSKTFIGTIGAGDVTPAGINIHGDVVATYRPIVSSSDTSVAYYDGVNQTWTLLGKFGAQIAWANDINDSGQIAGTYVPAGSAARAFIYTSGTDIRIPVPGKLPWESAYNDTFEINSNGMVCGRFKDISNTDKAYISDGVTVQELGALTFSAYSYATGLNDAGHAVGVSQDINFRQRAFLYKDLTVTNLGTLDVQSHASDINNNGIIVGVNYDSNSNTRAFIHDGTSMQDLTDLLNNSQWVLETADNINDAGMIIGEGLFKNEVHGYLLIPQTNP